MCEDIVLGDSKWESDLTDHKHGEMDITEQKKVYSGFIKFGIYVGLFSVFVLVFLALFNS